MLGIGGTKLSTGQVDVNRQYKRTGNVQFDELLKRKEASNVTAKEFLAGLSSSELYQIQVQNRLVSRINPLLLSDEAAENVLITHEHTRELVDLNNDGIVEIGVSKTLVFPPPNSPEVVKDAWDEITEGMTLLERTILEMPFLIVQFEANLVERGNGTYEVIEPGDPRYVNVFGNTVESFMDMLDKVIERTKNPLQSRTEEEKHVDEWRLDKYNLMKKKLNIG